MKKYLILILVVASTFASCSKGSSGTNDITPEKPFEPKSIFEYLKDKYRSSIPNIDKYSAGSISNISDRDTVIVAVNNDTDIDVFYFDKKDKLISSYNAPHTNKDLKIALVALPNQHINLNAVSIIFVDKSLKNYDTKDIKLINVYKTNDSKLHEFKSFKNEIEYSGWNRIIFKKSGKYLYHITDNVLHFVDPLNLNEIKSYKYWYNWTNLSNNEFLIFNDANDIITIKPSKYTGYYTTESAKIGLNNGMVVKNWEDQTGIYLPLLSLKTGEIERRKKTIKIEGSTVVVEFEIYTKLWDGKNNLVEKTENKIYRFNINSGVKI